MIEDPENFRTIEIPEKELTEILEKYLNNDELKKLQKYSCWILIILIFELIAISFFDVSQFIPYKAPFIFTTVSLVWFVWYYYYSWNIKKKAIAEILITFLAYQK